MKEKLLAVIPVILIMVVLYVVSRSVDPDILKTWIWEAGILGPLVIVFLSVLAAVVAPLSSTPLSFVGFALYGPNVVFLLAAGAVVSSVINFFIARKWGRPMIKKFVGDKNMANVDKFTKEHGIVSLFILRFLLAGVGDFLSYAMGLTNMTFKTYFLVSLAAAIPGVTIWYLIALKSDTALVFTLLTLGLALVFSAFFMGLKYIYMRTRRIKWLKFTEKL